MSVVYTFTEHYMWGLSWYADMYEREGCLSATGVSEKKYLPVGGVLVGFLWGHINTHAHRTDVPVFLYACFVFLDGRYLIPLQKLKVMKPGYHLHRFMPKNKFLTCV